MSSAADELLTMVLARSHTVTSAATTATPTPRTASMERAGPRLHPAGQRPAEDPSRHPEAEGHQQHGGEGHRRPGRRRVGPPHRLRSQQGPDVEACEEPGDGAHLDHGAHPCPLVGGGQRRHDDHHVDDVHDSPRPWDGPGHRTGRSVATTGSHGRRRRPRRAVITGPSGRPWHNLGQSERPRPRCRASTEPAGEARAVPGKRSPIPSTRRSLAVVAAAVALGATTACGGTTGPPVVRFRHRTRRHPSDPGRAP